MSETVTLRQAGVKKIREIKPIELGLRLALPNV